MQDVFARLRKRRKDDPSYSYKNYTNCASDAGLRKARGAGADDPVANAFATIQRIKAVDDWHKTS